ncbi:MAG: hypothetical protein FWG64_00205 [Firmicutes bacterium]|nr:hypothetical protein [Bacillota bacterium]
MIKIKKFKISEENERARLIQPIEIDGNNFDIYIEVESKYQQYFVTERADSALIGILHIAMRQNLGDIYSELPITSELLYNLNNILIPQLTKYDSNLTPLKIHAPTINEPVKNIGSVGTGLSVGVDGLTTIELSSKHPVENMRLTHFICFDKGLYGGFFHESGWDLQANLIHQNQLAIANELGLSVINLTGNIYKLANVRSDLWHHYRLAHNVLALGKLFCKYLYSSAGWDYSQYSIIPTSDYFSTANYALFFYMVINSGLATGTELLNFGGELSKMDKIAMLAKNELAKKYLNSCLKQAFNCGYCNKCRKSLLIFDALGVLNSFSQTYDITTYLANREQHIAWLIAMKKDKGSIDKILQEAFLILQTREPKLFEKIESQFTATSVLNLQKSNNYLKTCANSMLTLLKKPLFVEHIKDYFVKNNYKSVILYGNSEFTSILVAHHKELQINISHIVENTKNKKHTIPRLPINTVEYPATDAVIICAIHDPSVTLKKLQQRLNCPIIFAEEVFNYKNPKIKLSNEDYQISELKNIVQKQNLQIEEIKFSTNAIIKQKEDEIEQLKNRTMLLYESTSWKITKPLRKIKLMFYQILSNTKGEST